MFFKEFVSTKAIGWSDEKRGRGAEGERQFSREKTTVFEVQEGRGKEYRGEELGSGAGGRTRTDEQDETFCGCGGFCVMGSHAVDHRGAEIAVEHGQHGEQMEEDPYEDNEGRMAVFPIHHSIVNDGEPC